MELLWKAIIGDNGMEWWGTGIFYYWWVIGAPGGS